MRPEVIHTEWRPCCRIIPSRFPSIHLFSRATAPEDLDAIFELEALTNPRLRNEVNSARGVPQKDRISEFGASFIMAAFTHMNASGSRFSDGSFGVFYAADNLDTAIAETKRHREQFMNATAQPPIELDMQAYLIDLEGELHDLRGQRATQPLLYHGQDYAASQQLGRTLHETGCDGIVFDSVRQHDGACAAVFRPRILSNAREERHLCFIWDGWRIDTVYEKRERDKETQA